jgi:hypothetical protein
MSDAIATRRLVEMAHRQHPDLPIIARTHSESERQYLLGHHVDAVLAEQELALTMNRHALTQLGFPPPDDEDHRRPAELDPGRPDEAAPTTAHAS